MTQEQLDALLTEDLAALDTEGIEMPESFRTGWRQAVEEEAQMRKPSWPKKAILRMCSLAAALVLWWAAPCSPGISSIWIPLPRRKTAWSSPAARPPKWRRIMTAAG